MAESLGFLTLLPPGRRHHPGHRYPAGVPFAHHRYFHGLCHHGRW